MKTIQYYLEKTDREKILDRLAYDLLCDPLQLLELDSLPVKEIQEKYKKHMSGFIDHLLSLEPQPSDHMVLYMCDAVSYDGQRGQGDKTICLVDMNELRKDIHAPGYGFEMSPLEQTLGYLVADNKLTQDYMTDLLAQYLNEVSFFGTEPEQRKKQISQVHEDLGRSMESLKEGKGIPAKEALKEMARQYGFPVDEEDEKQDTLKSRIIKAEVEYSRYCHWRERKRILECAGFEAPEYSSLDVPEGTYAVHFCEMPSRDCARVWIGNDSSKYIDFHGFIADHSVIDWFEKYGSSVDEDWEFYYPQLARRMYLNAIQDRGYDRETAEQIIRYLPQTDTKYISVNVSQMIKLFEAGEPPTIPDECDPAKKKIAEDEPDFWDTEPYSPMGAKAEHQGYIKGVVRAYKRLSEEVQVPVKDLVEKSGMTEETKKEVLELLENEEGGQKKQME